MQRVVVDISLQRSQCIGGANAAVCDVNGNVFICLFVVCACANIAMLCLCREFHGVSVL